MKIQIPNGQIFKILTVKNSNRVITGEQSSKHVYNIPNPLGHHIWSILSLNHAKIWGGDPCPAVRSRLTPFTTNHNPHNFSPNLLWIFIGLETAVSETVLAPRGCSEIHCYKGFCNEGRAGQ